MPQLWAHPFLSLGHRSSESRATSDSLTDCKGRCPDGTAEGRGLPKGPPLVGLQGHGVLCPLICPGLPVPAAHYLRPQPPHTSPRLPSLPAQLHGDAGGRC